MKSKIIDTSVNPIEYAEVGHGPALIFIYGVWDALTRASFLPGIFWKK